MTKTIILLGAGGECVPIIQKAKDMGLRTVVVDGCGSAPGMALADVPVVASCYHADAALQGLRRSPIKGADGVMCAATDSPHVAAAIREEFGLPGLSVASARLSIDKGDQKAVLRTFGIPVPDSTGRNPLKPSIQSDWVIKPADSRGGRGVIRLAGVDYEWAYKTARALSPTGQVVIERWLDGPQYSTESIILGGRVMFTVCGLRNYDRLAEFAPYSIEDGFDVPSIPPCGIGAVNELIARACVALGWLDTAPGLTVKGDLIWHDDRLVILELAARLSGGYFCSHVTPMAYGIDFVYAAIKLALGEGLEWRVGGGAIAPFGAGFVSQRYVFSDPADIGRTVVSLPRVSDWAAWATWLIKPGDIIKPVTSHAARLGQACCIAGTMADAEHMAARAVAEMKAGASLE